MSNFSCSGKPSPAQFSQHLHGDGFSQRPESLEDADWYAYAVISIAVHDIAEAQAPMSFVGKQAMMAHCSIFPPATASDVDNSPHNFLLTMSRGEIFIRDPRVWHNGTPNFTDDDRFLPGAILQHRR